MSTSKSKTKKVAGIPVHCKYDKLVNLDKLIPNPDNPNQHPDEQIELLAKIIQENGWRDRIVVSNLSGMIVKGHGRYQAAVAAGLGQVPVEYQDYASAVDEVRDLIADNKIAELSSINDKAARELIESLDDINLGEIDLSGFGFTDDEIINLFPETTEGQSPDDEIPEVDEEPVTKPGDLYLLDEHRLLCGDATKAEDVERLMDGKKADMVFTSPPYNLGNSIKLSGNKKASESGKVYKNYNDNSNKWMNLNQESLKNVIDFARYVFWNVQSLSGNKKELLYFLSLNAHYYCDVSIWNKGHAQPSMSPMVMDSVFEFIFIFSKEQQTRRIGVKNFRGGIHNVFNIPPMRNNNYSHIHAATFPVALPEKFIYAFSNNNSLIIDIFIGTGTTLIACEKTNRICYGMEIDPNYCDIIVKRWEDYTGNKAELV